MRGQCLCGAIGYEVVHLAGPIAHCHCRTCRKAHASPYGASARVGRGQQGYPAQRHSDRQHARDNVARPGSGSTPRQDATYLRAMVDDVADNRRNSHRISCTSAVSSRRDIDATRSQDQFNIPQAEAKPVVQPDSMADDLGGEPMTIVQIGWRLHPASLSRLQATGQGRLP